MRPFVLLTVFVLISNTSLADELCSGWETKIEPDMQIQESEFTLERFDKALEALSALGREPLHSETWITQGNSLQFVHGWLLKKAAIEAAEDTGNKEAVDAFCKFLVNDAFYYD